MFRDILPNVSRHSPERLATFPRMFEDISRNMAFPQPHSSCFPHSLPRSCVSGFLHSLFTSHHFRPVDRRSYKGIL